MIFSNKFEALRETAFCLTPLGFIDTKDNLKSIKVMLIFASGYDRSSLGQLLPRR
jgi:hypothetical protein